MSKPNTDARSRGLYMSWIPGKTNNPDLNPNPIQAFFDVTISDEVEKVLDVTDHPVETGGDISDNARKRMDRFSFEVIVSDTPIVDPQGFENSYGGTFGQVAVQLQTGTRQIPLNPLGAITEGALALAGAGTGLGTQGQSVTALVWTGTFDKVSDMLTLLDSVQVNANLLKIVTSKYSFDNVMLTQIKQMRDKDIGSGARYRLEFKQIRLVTLEFTNAPIPSQPRGNPPANQGSKSSQQLTQPQESVFKFNLDKAIQFFK